MTMVQQRRIFYFLLAAILFFSLQGFSQDAGTVKGIVADAEGNPLIGANVYLEGTPLGSSTDTDGAFLIMNVPPGDYTIAANYVSYKDQSTPVSVSAGESVTVNFTMESDVLDLSAVVVTGTVNPKTKIESSVAISTFNEAEIRQRAPQNTAELLEAIPGFYVESSGGEGGNNLFARGIPADGSFRYVSLQEDGLPVFEDGELMFGNADLFLRVDETVNRMEAVRGGTGSIFASNAPGGIINFISKTGGSNFGGLVKLGTSDYGTFRMDMNVGGPLGDDWRFNVGGFYRYDEGIRAPGFTANQGGQIKGNITRLMDKGYVRANFKFLNENNIFYLPIPLTNADSPESITGFDANYGTMTSLNMNYLSVPTPKGSDFEKQLENGMSPRIFAVGAEFSYEFEGGWGVKNLFRYTNDQQEFNAIFSLSDPSSATGYAESQLAQADTSLGAAGYEYRDARTGEVITDPSNMNGNGLVATVGWWNVALPKTNFANDLQLSKSFGPHILTAGFYHTDWKVSSLWYWQDVLADVRGGEETGKEARALDLVLLDEAGNDVVSVTQSGLSRIGSNYENYSLDARTNAFYLNDEWTIMDALSLDGGIRFESGTVTGHVENKGEFDLGDPTTLADDRVSYGNGSFRTYRFEYDEWAFSVGGNYKFTPGMAAFGRVSQGFRTPDDQHFVFFEEGSFKVEDVFQYEAGLKFSNPNMGLFASFFGINFKNIPFSDEVVDQNGDIIRAFRFADSRTLGVEAEYTVKFGGFQAGINGTYQDPKYQNYDFISPNETETINGEEVSGVAVDLEGVPGFRYSFSDLRVRRIPKFFFSIPASYTYRILTLYGSFRYFGERFVDDANNNKLPAWGAFNAGVSLRLGNFILAVNGHNLTNTVGLTEGNPRAGQVIGEVKDIYMARPIFGRAFNGSLSYSF